MINNKRPQPRVRVGSSIMEWLNRIDEWTAWLVAGDKAAGTIKLRRYQIARLAAHYVHRNPWKLTSTELAMWMAGTGWDSETRRSYLAAIRSFYSWGVTVGYIAESPAGDLPSIKRKQHLPRPVPDDIYVSALAHADTVALRVTLLLMNYEGLRCVEAARLHRDDISDVTLRIRGKGDKERIQPLHRNVSAELRTEFALRDAGGCGTGFRYRSGIREGWLFPGRYGGHITPKALGRMVSRALGPGWSAHPIRHRFATRVYEQTGDITLVQILLGHANLNNTQIYTKVPTRFLTAAVDAL